MKYPSFFHTILNIFPVKISKSSLNSKVHSYQSSFPPPPFLYTLRLAFCCLFGDVLRPLLSIPLKTDWSATWMGKMNSAGRFERKCAQLKGYVMKVSFIMRLKLFKGACGFSSNFSSEINHACLDSSLCLIYHKPSIPESSSITLLCQNILVALEMSAGVLFV